MTLRQDPGSRARTRTRAGIPITRRRSPCYRHPEEPITGFCASCLRERLCGLEVSATPNAATPELRRCRSVVSASKCEGPSGNLHVPRRKSCDVMAGRSSLSALFGADDLRRGSETDVKVASKNAGLASVAYNVFESENGNRDEIRVLGDGLEGLNVECVDGDAEAEDGGFKTMKEYIDLEFQNKTKKSKDLRELAGNLLGAASVVSKKLLKWRQKNNETKKRDNRGESKSKTIVRDNHPHIVGRRSCDAGQTFSVDAGRISFEEPRASWDGYMIARTIPRLAPMLSAVETGILGNLNRFEKHRLSVDGTMHSIMEDESSSGASGSGQSNSDSSSSMRGGSSFDRSSSVRSCGKKVMNSEDSGASPVNVKLVITEKELKDWHLSSGKDDKSEKIGSISRNTAATQLLSSLDAPVKKSVRCRVRNIFGFQAKNSKNAGETMASDDANETAQVKEDGRNLSAIGCLNLGRSSINGDSISSCGVESNYSTRSVDFAGGYAFKGHEDFKLERSKSAKYSPAHADTGARPFYMTHLRSLRNSKSGKFKLQDSHSIAGHTLQLNKTILYDSSEELEEQ